MNTMVISWEFNYFPCYTLGKKIEDTVPIHSCLVFAIFGIPLISKKKKEKQTANGNLRRAKNNLI